MEQYLAGLLMGFAYVAPIGLQNLFVINTALTQKKSRVFLTALIVIFFDVTLAFGCFYGIGALMDRSEFLKKAILLVGSLIVLYIGYSILRSEGKLERKDMNIPLLKVVSSACVVTWFNPQAIIDGSMMLGAFRASLLPAEATQFILGVTSASFLWFLGLSFVLSLFQHFLNDKILTWINRVCGAVILIYAVKLFMAFVDLVK